VARIFITGSSRGIGLELARQYAARGDRVLATARNLAHADALHALAEQYGERVILIELDMNSEASIAQAVEQARGHVKGLDILINNAAISPEAGRRFGELHFAPLLAALQVNAVAPLILAQACADLLSEGYRPKIINITSQLGSMTRKMSGGGYAYSGSKAALNMYTRTLAFELKPRHITVIALHPGWVQTDLGGRGATLTVEQSVSDMIQFIDDVTIARTGTFFQWNGTTIPW
jgi:NAD(P)-dependent dehydrogenase (short-subunit alcohol dehydrogenase family)